MLGVGAGVSVPFLTHLAPPGLPAPPLHTASRGSWLSRPPASRTAPLHVPNAPALSMFPHCPHPAPPSATPQMQAPHSLPHPQKPRECPCLASPTPRARWFPLLIGSCTAAPPPPCDTVALGLEGTGERGALSPAGSVLTPCPVTHAQGRRTHVAHCALSVVTSTRRPRLGQAQLCHSAGDPPTLTK